VEHVARAIGNQLVTERGYRLVNKQMRGPVMAKRKDTEITGSEAAATPEPVKNELPTVESPSISPATEITPMPEPIAVEAPASEPKIESKIEAPVIEPVTTTAPKTAQLFALRPRHKRYALLAASMTLAAALGAIVGALASGGFLAPAPVKPDVATIEEGKAMQQSIARLGKEVTTLKASLEAANKSAHTQIAKITDRLEHAQADITGSISAQQTVAPALEPPPLPTPRPAPRITAAEAVPSGRTAIVPGWAIHDTRGGYVYVENHGEIYQVLLGAPLPGLGPVESVKRQDGRWVVTTPKGIIVSMRDRRYFEEF